MKRITTLFGMRWYFFSTTSTLREAPGGRETGSADEAQTTIGRFDHSKSLCNSDRTPSESTVSLVAPISFSSGLMSTAFLLTSTLVGAGGMRISYWPSTLTFVVFQSSKGTVIISAYEIS